MKNNHRRLLTLRQLRLNVISFRSSFQLWNLFKADHLPFFLLFSGACCFQSTLSTRTAHPPSTNEISFCSCGGIWQIHVYWRANFLTKATTGLLVSCFNLVSPKPLKKSAIEKILLGYLNTFKLIKIIHFELVKYNVVTRKSTINNYLMNNLARISTYKWWPNWSKRRWCVELINYRAASLSPLIKN